MGQHQPLQFSKGKCKALMLRSTDWEPTGRKEAEKAENGLRFLVDIKLTMSLQSTFVANKVNSIWAALGKTASRSREGILPLCSGLVRQIWSAGTSASLPSTIETWTYWWESSKGPQRQLRDWSIWHTRRGWRSWDSSACRRQGSEGSYQCVQIPEGGVKKMAPGSSWWYPATGQESMDINWNTGNSI